MNRISWFIRARTRWLLWVVALLAATFGLLLFRARLDKAHVALVYLLVVLGASSAGGRTLGFSIAAAAFLAFNYVFLPPYYTLIINDPLDWLVLAVFLVTSVVATQLLYRANTTAETAMRRAAEVDRLATLGAETLSAPTASAALDAMAIVIRDALDTDECALFRGELNDVVVCAANVHRANLTTPNDVSATNFVHWMLGRAEVAVELLDGTTRIEPVLSDALVVRTLYRTLRVRGQPVGVLRVSSQHGLTLSPDSARLLDALSYYAALGVERVRLERTVERAEAEREVEALRSALLMAVSHDLRTPLTTIKGIAHEIAHGGAPVRAEIIEAEADRLDGLIGDLLELSRIHAGAVRPEAAVNTIDELIGAALLRAQGPLTGHAVAVSLTDEVLIGRFDFSQTLRIVVNLLENAAKYTPTSAGIEVTATRLADQISITVADEGPGVPVGEELRIFEAFYRPAGVPPDVRGTGLGLSIARGLAVAQGGTLTYSARMTGGALFTLLLPAVNASLREGITQ